MSTISGIWSKSNSVESFLDIHHLENTNNWWKAAFTCKLKTYSLFFHGAYMDVENPRLTSGNFSYKYLNIICDARLDNRDEIIRDIKTLTSDCPDIKFIAALYLKYGENCLKYLKGAFAFVIYDSKNESIFCAVDHLGVKTLHYSNNKSYFSFGTQKKSVLAPRNFNKAPNWNFLAKFILKYHSDESDTEYKFISRLPAGTFLVIQKDNSIKLERYWSLDATKEIHYNNDSDYEEHFLDLATNAVKVRMRGVSKVATHLSGGLDSSGITGMASHLSSQTNQLIEAFGYTIPDKANLEKLPYANFNHLVTKQADYARGVRLHKVQKRIFRTLRNVVEFETQWTDGFSMLNKLNTEFEMHHAIQEAGFHVALSGFLGDALVTSFAKLFNLEYLEQGNYFKYFYSDIDNNLSYSKLLGILGLKVLNRMNILNKDRIAQIYHSRKKSPYRKNKLWTNHLFSSSLFDEQDFQDVYQNQFKSEYLYGFPFTLKEYQKNHVQRRFTSARMEAENAAGLNFHVQYRYPFVDIDLLQYVLSLPVDQKIKPGQTRSLYRRSMKKYIYKDILKADNKDGHVKPMQSFYKIKTRASLMKMYEELKESNCLSYLNIPAIDEHINNMYIPPNFNFYLTYGELKRQGKMNF